MRAGAGGMVPFAFTEKREAVVVCVAGSIQILKAKLTAQHESRLILWDRAEAGDLLQSFVWPRADWWTHLPSGEMGKSRPIFFITVPITVQCTDTQKLLSGCPVI